MLLGDSRAGATSPAGRFKIPADLRFKLAFDLCKVATRKVTMLEAATVLEDLRSPPGNRLEALVTTTGEEHGR
jgi:plasmid maintenance system killer protein